MTDRTIVITGAAGLVGQNLIVRLKARGFMRLIGIDKHPTNTAILARLHPDITVIEADLAEPGAWAKAFEGADTLVQAHAQIGGPDIAPFNANNITATKYVLSAARAAGVAHIVHLSSSVVNSAAIDFYTETKKAQESLTAACPIPQVVLRPTLMFGWFDRKHLGWLARFMRRIPVFPIPGNGKYLRQPLYVGDFCNIIIACIEGGRTGAYNISGLETVNYIDLIAAVRRAAKAWTVIVPIPFWLFRILLSAYGLIDKNPPFTPKQLAALATPDVFEVIDWPGIFAVTPTKLDAALTETFQAAPYASIVLAF
jgi:nucleoside-diphosphate-sugar epimerase